MTIERPERPVVPGSVDESYYTYNTRYIPSPGPPEPQGGRYGGIRVRGFGSTPRPPGWDQPYRVMVPKQMPSFFGDRRIIMNAWFAAIVLVSYDEWVNYGVLPRPARLWYTSGVYAILMLVSVADAAAPFANLLAIGFTFVLLYQLMAQSGQFTKTAGNPPGTGTNPAQGTGTTQAPGTTTAAGRG